MAARQWCTRIFMPPWRAQAWVAQERLEVVFIPIGWWARLSATSCREHLCSSEKEPDISEMTFFFRDTFHFLSHLNSTVKNCIYLFWYFLLCWAEQADKGEVEHYSMKISSAIPRLVSAPDSRLPGSSPSVDTHCCRTHWVLCPLCACITSSASTNNDYLMLLWW